MFIANYWDDLVDEVRNIVIIIQDIFYENYGNPLLWIIIVGVIVFITMATFNSLNK